jgi:carbon monoxide dehydrogenase subunit G
MNLTFKIKKPADFIFEYLTDMQKFVAIHPVITKIKPTGNNTYLVYETLRFLGMPFSFTYPVVVNGNSPENSVIISATVMKLTKIKMVFKLKPDIDFTVVAESIEIKSPLPVKRTVQRIFKEQHEQLFKNLEMIG